MFYFETALPNECMTRTASYMIFFLIFFGIRRRPLKNLDDHYYGDKTFIEFFILSIRRTCSLLPPAPLRILSRN